MPIRITGLNSGLDTEAIISALVSSYSYKTDKYKKAQTKLSWKQDAWKALNTKIYSLYNSVGNLRFSSAYNMKSTTVSDSTKVSVKAGSGAVNGSYSVQVTSLAKSGYLTGAQLASGTKASATLEDLGYTGADGKLSVTVGGSTTDIAVTKDSTIQDVVNQLKDAGVNASYDETNRRIYVSAEKSGVENDFSLAGADANGNDILATLGLSVESAATINEYRDLVTYVGLNINQIVQNKKTAEESNAVLKAENANYQKAVNYVNASLAVDAVGAGKNVGQFELLKSLASTDTLNDKYVDTANNIYTYDKDKDVYRTTLADGSIREVASANIGTSGLETASDKYDELAKSFGLVTETTDDKGTTVKDSTKLTEFKENLATVKNIAAEAENGTQELKDLIADAETAIQSGTTAAQQFVTDTTAKITANEAVIKTNDATLAAHSKLNANMTAEDIAAFEAKVAYADSIVDANGDVTLPYSAGATRVDGSDAVIYVNGARYTGDSNTFSINGMTFTANGITATDETALKDETAVNVTVNTDVQGIYDKIKDFLTQYNTLINEMSALYNAPSAKGYEPLTDAEKDSLSDTEVEKWEEKIKASLLRRDDTLSSVMNAMTSAMSKGVTVGDETLYLSTFGIKTLGYFSAAANERNAYHIDGDEDDVATSGNADKLMAAIAEDPDRVLEFMKGLATNLYEAVDSKMKGTTLRTSYTVYNDKEMASEYSDYTSLITKWQEKLQKQEEYYYQKFAAMETALSKLNSQTSSLTGLFGS